MRKKLFFPWLAVIASLFLAGCGGGVSFSLTFFGGFPANQVQPLAFQEVQPVLPSAITERHLVVIRDLTAWDSLWREHTAGISPQPALPSINFTQDMVVGIFLGRHATCREVEIRSVSRHANPDRIEVSFREIPSSSGTNCPSGGSNPAKLILLAYSFLPVEFFQVS